MPMPSNDATVRIRQIRLEAQDIISLVLQPELPAVCAPYQAGAHLPVQIPGGPRRSSSLLDAAPVEDGYRIAVKREPRSQGASAWLHDQARVGMTLQVGMPRNDFTLAEHVGPSVLVAGGIGITPLLAMAEQLTQLGRPWQLHYAAKTRAQMAFVPRLAQLAREGQGELHCYCSAEGDARMYLQTIEAASPPDAHWYGCGPTALIEALQSATRQRAPQTVHFERFTAAQTAAKAGGYTLTLARSGRQLAVPAGRSILNVLLDADINVAYACTQGVCGSCRIGVLAGEPDHRDDCLSEAERAANTALISCCAGSLSPELVLDL